MNDEQNLVDSEKQVPDTIEDDPLKTTDAVLSDPEDSTPSTDTLKVSPESTSKVDNVQKRINKIVAERYAAEARAEAAERKLTELQKKQVVDTPELTSEEYENEYDYDEDKILDAKIQHRVKVATSKYEQAQALKRQEDEKRALEQDFLTRVTNAKIPDYSKVVTNLATAIPIPEDLITAIQLDENGPQLAYYLGNNLDVADKLVKMNPTQGALELGKLSVKLSTTKPKNLTKAPDPIKTVGSGGAPPKSLENMSMEEIYAL
jgi:hypothetical protein